MKTILFAFIFLLPSFGVIAQYQCTPCNLECDTLAFANAGDCSQCHMPLIPTSTTQFSGDEMLKNIRALTLAESNVMRSVSYLSDVYGPRFFGTSNYYQSALWIEKELKKWGINSVEFQSFDLNNEYVGWQFSDFKVAITTPFYSPLQAYPLAFSRSTKGEQTAETMAISSFEDVYDLGDTIQGKILLLKGYYSPVTNRESPMSTRLSEETLLRAKANPDPNDVIIGYHSRRTITDVFEMRQNIKEERAKFFTYCQEKGVVAIVEPSDFPYGILHADGNRAVPSFHKKTDLQPVASFVLANEHFGRLLRLTDMGFQPKLTVNLSAERIDNPAYHVNVIAEIKGVDPVLKDQLVIMGAHLDGWHAGTGAVDNASSCAVIMEALRLIHETGIRPKRTIRIILWGGEEQVFSGSSFYVNKQVGNLTTGKPEAEQPQISAYLNLDNGAGKIRGIYLMGNEKIAPYFSEYLQPFPASQTLTLQNANQTDHELFDYQNVPAFQFIQDPLDYMTAIHHTNMDVYEYVPAEDQRYNAELLAYLALRIAQEKTQLPRKSFNSPLPSKTGNTTFKLEGFSTAQKVYLVGDFNNWNMFGTPLYKSENGWETKIDLPKGRYYYKYIVDGHWTADPSTPEREQVKDGKGHSGLTILHLD